MHFSVPRTSSRITVVPFVLVAMFAAAQLAPDQTETVLYSFGLQAVEGATPWDRLIMDAQGNLYGTTEQGGKHRLGTVFELSPPAKKGGAWTETVLYSFGSQSNDGANPYDSLVMDGEGNLYGTTYYGGADNFGTVFQLSPNKAGKWTEKVLYSFSGAPDDGSLPFAGLIMDNEGNLYGTTYTGGANKLGTVFELSPPAVAGGAWTEAVLHGFGGAPNDGLLPYAGLVADKKGNLYGTTTEGGAYTFGTVFKLSPPARKGGAWREVVLYSFGGQSGDGVSPYASLIVDQDGNFYGATTGGGAYLYGEAFELYEESSVWTETVLYSFGSYAADGAYPFDGLIRDKDGNLYGTTTGGGRYSFGTVFKMTPPAEKSGSWTETLLYTFGRQSKSGEEPWGSLLMDNEGNLYGTTTEGGATNHCDYGCGTVFKLSPEKGQTQTEPVL